MFERRLKFFLGFLAVFILVLLLRAGQVQIVDHEEWSKAAAESMKRSQLIETIRGSILDRNGKLLAVDQPCVDVCIDYRAITDPPDEKWVLEKAEQRMKSRLGDEWDHTARSKRKELAAVEAQSVRQDIAQMWTDLGKIALKTPAQVENARREIVHKVEMRQRIARDKNLSRVMKQDEERKKDPMWRRWLVEGIATDKAAPDNYVISVAEETESHVLLRAVDVAIQNYLGKRGDRYPGLELKPSTHRTYPYGSVACQLMGRVSRVGREDLLDPNAPREEGRQYLPNDEIGRGGVEGLCESALRGTKGQVERVPGQQAEVSRVDPLPGHDVRLTIDVDLQSKIEAAFGRVELHAPNEKDEVAEQLHGAAVVIDVKSGEVLALVSAPTYDLNTFEEFYKRLADDDLNHPLLNRATMAQLQPGSTMKPIVGLSAITQKLITPETAIECTGYMINPNGSRSNSGRCWVASKFEHDPRVPNVAHHPIPTVAPHPTGFLTYGDALERSCNVFFETCAGKFGFEGLSVWYERFGLGRPTGIGIAESRGRLPRMYGGPDGQQKLWYSGIGQDPVAATPIQMANAITTIARNGIWRRPRLIPETEAADLGIVLPELKPAPRKDIEVDEDGQPESPLQNWPDAYDLQLDPRGLAAAHDGMQRVVYGAAGTGKNLVLNAPKLEGLRICGKTGTAQAPKFVIKERDSTGAAILDEQGRPKLKVLEPSTAQAPNPIAPWYRGGGKEGRELDHAWYVGFAPADNPKIAFAVMVEYGGSGGGAAAAVARETLTACVEQGYLSGSLPRSAEAKKDVAPPAELLHEVAVPVALR